MTGSDASHRVDELVDVHDPVIEQVADAAAPVCEQLGGVAVLDVLRYDEHGSLGSTFAELECGAQAGPPVGGARGANRAFEVANRRTPRRVRTKCAVTCERRLYQVKCQ